MYSVIVISYPSASSMIWFFSPAGILIVRVVRSLVATLGGRPLRFILKPMGYLLQTQYVMSRSRFCQAIRMPNRKHPELR